MPTKSPTQDFSANDEELKKCAFFNQAPSEKSRISDISRDLSVVKVEFNHGPSDKSRFSNLECSRDLGSVPGELN